MSGYMPDLNRQVYVTAVSGNLKSEMTVSLRYSRLSIHNRLGRRE